MDPHVVLAMSESALTCLGVAAVGDRIRIKQLCREAVDCSGVSNGVDSVDRDSSRRVNSESDKDRFVL